MTTGFPDFQDYPIWRGTLGTPLSQVIQPGSDAIAFQQLGSYASLQVTVLPPTNGVQVNVDYFTDSTLAVPVGGYVWTLIAGSQFNVTVPNLGNYVRTRISTTIAGFQTVTIYAQPCNTPVPKPTYPLGQNVFNGAVNPAASQTITTYLPFPMEGTGFIGFTPNDASGKLSVVLYQVTQSKVSTGVIWRANLVTTWQGTTFQCGPTVLAVDVINTDGVAAHPSNLHFQVESP